MAIKVRRSLLIAYTALGIALVCIFTIMIQVYIPATKGYFNIGEAAIYILSMLLPPVASGLSAGLGSSLADILTGYLHYAPATFIIKGLEGYIASTLIRRLARLKDRFSRKHSSLLNIPLIAIFSAIVFSKYTGKAEITSFITFKAKHSISVLIWSMIVLALLIFMTYTAWRNPKAGFYILCFVLAGLEMVTGYFLYEAYVLPYFMGIAGFAQALIEVPYNICQVLVGCFVASLALKYLQPYISS